MKGLPEQWKSQPGVTTYQIQDWDESHKALAAVIAKIRQSLDLENIFNTTVTEVRQLLQTDRVGVLRFDRQMGWQGELIWEDVGEQWVRGLDLTVRDHCFGDRFAPLYRQGRISAIRDIYQHGLKDCHVQILEQFQVRANLVAPLLKEEQLWGLLCIHQCSGPRTWKMPEIEFASQIAEHLGVALQQNELLEQARDRARREKALNEVITRIRGSLDLETIFTNTVTEMRQLLQADRVGVWRFYPKLDWEGEFIWEDVDPYCKSAMSEKIRDRCVAQNWLAWHQEDRISVIPDIYTVGLEPCHRQMLEKFQIRANIAVPLWTGDSLWGLLCVHQCMGPRDWEQSEIEFVRQIAEHLTVAIQQANYLEQVQAQSAQLAQAKERDKAAQCQKALLATVDKIRRSLDIDTIFETTTQEVRQLLEAERVTIFRLSADVNTDRIGEFVAESVGALWRSVLGNQWSMPDSWWQATPGTLERDNQTLAVDEISKAQPYYNLISLPESFQAKAFMMSPIFQGDRLWGFLGAYQNSAPRHWQGHEVDLLAQIGSQLGIALQQAAYLKQVQVQSAQLAIASEQEKAAGRHKTLVKTIDKIRRSLDVEVIFSTTTEEVRELLAVEGVAIYRCRTNQTGEIVAASANLFGISSEGNQGITIDTFWPGNGAETYAGNIIEQVSVVDDISEVDPSNSQLALLVESVAAKAYIIVPILQGEQLWGLLAVYQNSSPRHWQEYEVDLLIELSSQLGIALQQGELLEQTRQQTAELARTLKKLQETQSHLIQSEKMVALGQLVAGIAHEINNPVNFIYANIEHADEYAKNLLDLLNLYEECYPEPKAEIEELSEEMDLDFVRDDLAKTLESMKIGANRIRQIVLSLRTFSRLDESEMKPVNIQDGIDSTLVILQNRLQSEEDSRRIEVVKEYGELPKVECYGAQLNQVFMNILNNAIDALIELSPQNPTITISTQVANNQAEITIADNGSGIPDRVRSRIFDPFFTTKQVGKGTGLGLSISYQIIVDKHKGQLQCVSQPDRGTEFLISIPLRRTLTKT